MSRENLYYALLLQSKKKELSREEYNALKKDILKKTSRSVGKFMDSYIKSLDDITEL